MYAASHFSENKIRVEEEKNVQEVALADLTPSVLQGVAAHYRKHGDGPLSLRVSYDPHAHDLTAMGASEKAASIVAALREEGVVDVDARILPVRDAGQSSAIFSYLSYSALPPEDCTLMAGLESHSAEADEDYKLGCSVNTMFARQIARPKDLKGRANSDVSDGRRAANQVEVYRTGVPNDPLGGESASGSE